MANQHHPEFFKAREATQTNYIARAHITWVEVPDNSVAMAPTANHKEPIRVHVIGRSTPFVIFAKQTQLEFLAWLATPPALIPAPPAPPAPPPADRR